MGWRHLPPTEPSWFALSVGMVLLCNSSASAGQSEVPPLSIRLGPGLGDYAVVEANGAEWLRGEAAVVDGTQLVPCDLEAAEPTHPVNENIKQRKPHSARIQTGMDAVGPFSSQPDVHWCHQGTSTVVVITAMKTYSPDEFGGNLVTTITQSFPHGLSETNKPYTAGGQTTTRTSFPSFVQPPLARDAPVQHARNNATVNLTTPLLNGFTYWGASGMHNELNRLWAPGAFANNDSCDVVGDSKGCDGMGPLVIYSNTTPPTTLVISGASEFLHHQTAMMGKTLSCGVRGTLRTVPPGYSVSTILVGGRGVTATTRLWGRVLLQQHGKEARLIPGSAANRDPSLRYLSYWTDRGAAYYYNTEGPNITAEQTMVDVKKWMIDNKIPTRVYQFDSWWYPKDTALPGSPVLLWEPLPSVFPDGFTVPWLDTPNQTGAAATRSPLVLHNRAFSPKTPYNKSWFVTEAQLALPVRTELFLHIMAPALPLGLRVYEQDWISLTHMKMAAPQESVLPAREWFVAMDDAATVLNLTIQLCMQFPRHVLHTVELSAVTQARASADYHAVGTTVGCSLDGVANLTCTQWNIGLTSLFFSAIGIVPSKDNFRSTVNSTPREPNPLLQALVAGLSGGPVGPSDPIGTMDFTTVHHIGRGPDGYLNKPDAAATPLDLTFNLGFGDVGRGLDSLPTVWSASTQLGLLTWQYILAVGLSSPVVVGLDDLGYGAATQAVAFEYFPECWRNETAAQRGECSFEVGLGHTVLLKNDHNSRLVLRPGGVRGNGVNESTADQGTPFRYVIVAPVLASGWVLLGETGKFFPATRDRIKAFGSTTSGGLQGEIQGAPNEHVKVECFTPSQVRTMGTAPAGTALRTIATVCPLGSDGLATLRCEADECTCVAAEVSDVVSL